MSKYTIGVDFGTLSGRAIITNVENGAELACASREYNHGVMDTELPCGTKLGRDWALQHPQDYLDVLKTIIPDVIKKSSVLIKDIIGLGIDFTSCTILPVKSDGTPLCFLDKYKSDPHAYVKLWKHHAAQGMANKINQLAEGRKESWLPIYGGKISSEWFFPKVLQVLEEAPYIYDEADFFIEAADWIIWQLTGVQTRNSCSAGCKAIWSKTFGCPQKEFLKVLNPKFENVIEDKMNCKIQPLGGKAGEINKYASQLTGLNIGTAVAVGNVDAHVTLPAVKIGGPGKMLAIMGTSTCHIIMDTEEKAIPGICGVVEDGVLPGYFAYEAGQSCVGDHFAWFMDNCVPFTYYEEAKSKGVSIFGLMNEKVANLKPGESGLIALDWWNGNRSVLVDADLTGLIIGMTLQTKPEEIYRALIEATAFGTRKIIETFENNGIKVDTLYASGGISQKDPTTMQIYSDIIGKNIIISGGKNAPALGSSIFAAVAAGSERGGYDDIFLAIEKMGSLDESIYEPNPQSTKIYDRLYSEYILLHDYFGKGTNNVMKRLKKIKITNENILV